MSPENEFFIPASDYVAELSEPPLDFEQAMMECDRSIEIIESFIHP